MKRGRGSGQQTVRSLVETWRAASHRPQGLAHGTNAGGIQGANGETRHATSLLSAGNGHTDDADGTDDHG